MTTTKKKREEKRKRENKQREKERKDEIFFFTIRIFLPNPKHKRAIHTDTHRSRQANEKKNLTPQHKQIQTHTHILV